MCTVDIPASKFVGRESGSKLPHSKASHARHTRKTLDNSALLLF